MSKIQIKIFSLLLIFNLALFTTAGSFAIINCSNEMQSCCCSGSIINNDIEIKSSCCECFVDNFINDTTEITKALISKLIPDLNGSLIKNNFTSVSQNHTDNFNTPDFSDKKENIFLLNSNLRI
jgi:hypothetical protein